MSEYLQNSTKLLVISDTALAYREGVYYGFGPVVREFEHLEKMFDKIIWIGYDNTTNFDKIPFQKIDSNRIELILLKKVGGKSLMDKFKIILNYPILFFFILKNIIKVKYIHTRAPSHPAFIGILLSFIFINKHWWHKFAGSWDPSVLPKFYKFQRQVLLKAKNSKVTINGVWKNQPKHCISFENPCLDSYDRNLGKIVIEQKNIENEIEICFVGALNEAKGVSFLIDILKTNDFNQKISKFHFVGNGDLMEILISEHDFKIPVQIHGQLDKKGLIEIYSKCHFLILPSKSEGFPKVVSEAMNYGCIPIVSDVSAIGQVIINNENGFLIDKFRLNSILNAIKIALNIHNIQFKNILLINYNFATVFSYHQYMKNIENKIF